MKQPFEIGDLVEKKGSKSDYTTGRTGTILEIDQTIKPGIENNRARVHWTSEPRNGGTWGQISIRTWVRFKDLKLIQPAILVQMAETAGRLDDIVKTCLANAGAGKVPDITDDCLRRYALEVETYRDSIRGMMRRYADGMDVTTTWENMRKQLEADEAQDRIDAIAWEKMIRRMRSLGALVED